MPNDHQETAEAKDSCRDLIRSRGPSRFSRYPRLGNDFRFGSRFTFHPLKKRPEIETYRSLAGLKRWPPGVPESSD